VDILAVLQESAPGQFLRLSWWAYPLVNIVHVLGIATLFGAVLVLDLRLLGFWRSIDPGVLARPAATVAASGLAVALLSGLLLFSARARDYAGMPVFWAKMACVAVGIANAVLMQASGLNRRRPALAGAISLAAWTSAIAAGRLIGYGAN
jgi:hypothetical protein